MKSARTPLKAQELRHYRKLLLEKRAELVGDLAAIENEELHADDGDLSHLPIHMADIGTDSYNEDLLRSLAENERQLLYDIDESLARIANGTYGLCEATGVPIPTTRLEIMPWARFTVEAERERERESGPVTPP
jgi:RNA polymerase-binding transcription factor DksA